MLIFSPFFPPSAFHKTYAFTFKCVLDVAWGNQNSLYPGHLMYSSCCSSNTPITCCTAGKYRLDNTGTCTSCVAGQYTNSPTSACKSCEAGQFQELAEASEYKCKFCVAGTAFDTTSTACVSCPTVPGATCEKCSDAETCTTLTCAANKVHHSLVFSQSLVLLKQ